MQGENLYARGSVMLWPTKGSVWCSANALDLYLHGCWLELRPDHKLMYLRCRLSHCRLHPNNFKLSLYGTSALVYQSQIRIYIQIIHDNQAFIYRYKNLKKKQYNCICGNKMSTRCNRSFYSYCRSYCLLNMFRAPLCPSSGA